MTDPRVEQILSPEELALYKGTTKPAKLAGTMLSALAEGRGWGREREVLLNKQLARVAAGCAMAVSGSMSISSISGISHQLPYILKSISI